MSEESEVVREEPQHHPGRPKGSGTKSKFLYEALINAFPRPGGEGAHAAFYRAGILGFKAGVPESKIVSDVEEHMRPGGRVVRRSEIEQGVGAGFRVALEEATGVRKPEPPRAAPKIRPDTFKRIVSANRGATIESIMAKSPVKLDFPEWEAGWRTIDALYSPEDLLYIGGARERVEIGVNIRTAAEWVKELRSGPPRYPHIIPNVLTGEEAPTQDGATMTLRGDENVKLFRHAVAEMDSESIEDQLAFWSWVALPVRALIMSGGKSIHAWIDVQCENVLEWELEIEEKLFPEYLIPLGCDHQCRNESRVSRLPGHVRGPKEKNPGAMQKLIWLSPDGKAVCE